MLDIRQLNLVIELWAVAFAAITIVGTLLFAQGNRRYKVLFTAALALLVIAAVGDIVAGLYRGQPGELAWAMTHVGNLSTFLASFLIIPVFNEYICLRVAEAGGTRARLWLTIVQAGALIMCVLTCLGVFYTIDDANVYHRSDLYWIAFLYTGITGIINTLFVFRHRKLLSKLTLACLITYTVLPLVTPLLQLRAHGINYVIASFIIGLEVCYLEMRGHSVQMLIDRTEQLAQARQEATESRIAAMSSQIQPHFLFNTLDTIYGLCDEDPELAKEAIVSFSRYLRTNLDTLRQPAPVPIETELQHVKTYLDLERLSDDGRFGYEIETSATGFSVPPLSVQTIVENAVRHGLRGHERGHVRVAAIELPEEYQIIVEDDGVGFTPADIADDRPHVGIQNTRGRLEAMCGGSLDIESTPGEGTTVTLHIPKSDEQRDCDTL